MRRWITIVFALAFSSCGDNCEERLFKARTLVDAAIVANKSCRVDADCVVIDLSTDCYGNCSGSVADSSADEVRDAIGEANDKHCERCFRNTRLSLVFESARRVRTASHPTNGTRSELAQQRFGLFPAPMSGRQLWATDCPAESTREPSPSWAASGTTSTS